MSVKASITIDGIAAMKPEAVRAAGRAAMRVVIKQWIDAYLPIHFTNAAMGRYRYTPRAKFYNYRKRQRREIGGVRSIGEDKPLVWSGRSRERAKNARGQLENGSTGSVVGYAVIDAPALNFKATGSNIDMRDEVTRVSQAELNELAALFTKEFEAQLNKRGRTTRRRRAA